MMRNGPGRAVRCAALTLFLSCVVLGSWTNRSAAQGGGVLASSTLGAVLAIPYLTTPAGGGERISVATVTNALTRMPVSLKLVWISGDSEDAWLAFDSECDLTPLETTFFVFEREDDGARVTYECSRRGADSPWPMEDVNRIRQSVVPGSDGILVVVIQCQLGNCNGGREIPVDALAGDVTVLDFGQGFSFSTLAFHFQSRENFAADGVFLFDDDDLAATPAFLGTNFIAPSDDITLELLLFTLDGTIGETSPLTARLFGFAYDDDEDFSSAVIEFDCFTILDVASIIGFGPILTQGEGGSLVGHLELTPISASAEDLNELLPPTGDASLQRKRPVLGLMIQTIAETGSFGGDELPVGSFRMLGSAAWSRQLVSGTTPLVPSGTDVPALVISPE